MTNQTDSDSMPSFSSSEQKRKQKKLHKKLKKISEKKHKKEKKRHKEKKRSREEVRMSISEEDHVKPKKRLSETKNEEIPDTFGPALPPHLLNKDEQDKKNEPILIGPIVPTALLGNLEKLESQNPKEKVFHNINKSEVEDTNLKDSYGPFPTNNQLEMTPAQLELEQRALELKMAALDGNNTSTSNQNVREEWMLELPNVGLKSGLAALNNLKRTFHQGKEKPDFTDRSSWTKTPNSFQEKQKSTLSKEDLVQRAQSLHEKQRDDEQDDIARRHKKKHKREESLVEIHQKKLRKEEKKKLKELKESGTKPERRPFTRDVDLKLNKIDRNQTKQIVDKAKILNTKFSSGSSKYL